MAKGVVTNTIQFRGYNSVQMAPGAVFRCDAYNVQGLDTISQSVWVYAASALASNVRAKTRFIGDNGLTMSTVNHSFVGPAGSFEWMTFEAIPVPVGAKYAALEFVSPAGTYYLTMPKTDQGEKCTEYTANFSGQMTYITPTGVYTGVVTAGQVVLAGGNNLGTEMVTINNRLLTLTNTQNSHSGVISTHTTQLSALGMRVTWAEDDLTQVETDISAGNITLSSLTNGTLAGLGISSDRLEFTSAGSYMRIMSRAGYDFLRAGTSSSNILFKVSETGALTATGASITGEITAQSGKIGGFTINAGTLSAGTGAKHIQLSGGTDLGTWPIIIGATTPAAAKFAVDPEGNLTAKGAKITGEITAQSGTIGGFTIGNGVLEAGSGTGFVRITGQAGWASIIAGGENWDEATFGVSSTGFLKATNASITGTITAGSVFAGNLSSAGGSVVNLGGTLSGMGGLVSGLGGTFGNISGLRWTGPITAANGFLGGVSFATVGSSTMILYGTMLTQNDVNARDLIYNRSLVNASDIHYKQNVQAPETKAIVRDIFNLEIRDYEYKSDPGIGRIGVIANDVVSEAPSLSKYMIKPNGEGYLMADYVALSTLSILAVQDLNARVKALEKRCA